MTSKTFRYVRHGDVQKFEANGWTVAADFKGTHHHRYSVLMEAPRMIVGLTGLIGCGKSTVAGFLAEEFGYHRHRMAGPLKAMMRCLGLDDRHIEGDLKEAQCDLLGGKTPRFAMQTIGTEWGRDTISPDIWTTAWRATLPGGDVVCEDVRFQNEAKAVKDAGGIVIRIIRPGIEIGSHQSEAQEFAADFILRNDASPDAICAKVWDLITHAQDPLRAETFAAAVGG